MRSLLSPIRFKISKASQQFETVLPDKLSNERRLLRALREL